MRPKELNSSPPSEAASYRIYGVDLATDKSFLAPLPAGGWPPDLTLEISDRQPPSSRTDLVPVYTSPHQTSAGKPVASLYDLDGYLVIRFSGVGEFHLWSERIVLFLDETQREPLAELRLLGAVLALWLELQGLMVLHASASVVDDTAMAFCSSNRGGKSSLAATLAQNGHPLLSDDVLALEMDDGRVMARAGYPQMRMWPDLACHFLGADQKLDTVLPGHEKQRVPVGENGLGTFCEEKRPLRCLYLPERLDAREGKGTDIAITAVSRREAIMELLRYGFVSRMADALVGATRRLDFLADLVRQVPVFRLTYPKGFQHLPRVCRKLVEHHGALDDSGRLLGRRT